jgi:hypothetical protein
LNHNLKLYFSTHSTASFVKRELRPILDVHIRLIAFALDRPLSFSSGGAATRRILWLTCCELEGIAGIHHASGVPASGGPPTIFGADHSAEPIDPAPAWEEGLTTYAGAIRRRSS